MRANKRFAPTASSDFPKLGDAEPYQGARVACGKGLNEAQAAVGAAENVGL